MTTNSSPFSEFIMPLITQNYTVHRPHIISVMKRISTEFNDISRCIPNKVKAVETKVPSRGIQLNNTRAIISPHDVINLAVEIRRNDNFLKDDAQDKLRIIAAHTTFPENLTEKVLSEAEANAKLYHATCNFVKHPGNIYHLYEKNSGQWYFSILSPEEWANNGPTQTYKGSFRLEHNHSWTPLSQIKSENVELNIFDRHLSSGRGLVNNLTNTMNMEF